MVQLQRIKKIRSLLVPEITSVELSKVSLLALTGTLILAERGIDTRIITAKHLERFAKYSVLALRTNIVRNLTGLDHRDFATRLADSPLLQWFL